MSLSSNSSDSNKDQSSLIDIDNKINKENNQNSKSLEDVENLALKRVPQKISPVKRNSPIDNYQEGIFKNIISNSQNNTGNTNNTSIVNNNGADLFASNSDVAKEDSAIGINKINTAKLAINNSEKSVKSTLISRNIGKLSLPTKPSNAGIVNNQANINHQNNLQYFSNNNANNMQQSLNGQSSSPINHYNSGNQNMSQFDSSGNIPSHNLLQNSSSSNLQYIADSTNKQFISGNNDDLDDLEDGNNQLQNNNAESKTLELKELKLKTAEELISIAISDYNLDNIGDFGRQDVIYYILKNFSEQSYGNVIIGEGVLEVLPDGFGFLRTPETNYFSGSDDIYVSPSQIKRFSLRTGDTVKGQIRAPKKGERYFALLRVNEVNYDQPEKIRNRVLFDDLTPLFPQQKLQMENKSFSKNGDLSARIIDMFSPIGKGQRALIVAPPKTGKTSLMQNIAKAITDNNPEVILIVLLIDERPEEVTEMIRTIKGEVVSSTFDEPATRHVQLAEMIIEKAKRLVEAKKDVVILLDSITRLARAYNTVVPSSGKVLTGGVDSNALQKPKRFFGAARNIEEGGSLTIIATALIDTGSKMEEVIFEEFKGTGNCEIVLDRKISDKRIFPAIDITKSGTRKEEMLIDRGNLSKIWMLRRIVSAMSPLEAMEFLIAKIGDSDNNEDFFKMMNS
jgi:transcription termination factor Rho